ncbi:MAG: methyl-accepting chemotaxis protein [Rubrivivax sp.]|nr:methyl-accepting chemotaxis protein [Rubrivivax sp.]
MKQILLLLRSFTIRLRMAGAVVMVLGLFAVVATVGLLGGWQVKTLSDDFMHLSVQDIETVATLRQHIAQVRLLEKQMVIDYEDGVQVLKHREAWLAELATATKALQGLLEGEEDEDNPLAREAVTRLASYAQRSATVLDNIQNGGYDNARTADRMLTRAKEEVAAVETLIGRIAAITSTEATATRDAVNAAMTQVSVAFVATLAVVVLVVWPLTILNSRSITGPIGYAVSVAEAIAAGDLTRPIRIEGRDETATLLASLQRMQASLSRVVGQVQASSQSIHVASAEVASGNGDLSQRTEESAAALQQTASSMEQLTATLRQSADAAHQARELAVSASGVAERGGHAVATVVATMEQINTSSRRIADIVATIDGIAFQTNILALNAAVEAARAGEQGRGFAVVASEVRSLASRSADAAREIKGLIGASVERVEAGSQQVATAGRTMSEIVVSVQRVSQIIGEISAAALEQSTGIGPVNQSVTQLDKTTQQNAALVEESAAAADSLKEQAARLADVVSTFRLQPEHT